MGGNSAFKTPESFFLEGELFDNRIAPKYISTKLAAYYLGISENALRIKVCRGEVPAHKFGRLLRFNLDEIANLFTKK